MGDDHVPFKGRAWVAVDVFGAHLDGERRAGKDDRRSHRAQTGGPVRHHVHPEALLELRMAVRVVVDLHVDGNGAGPAPLPSTCRSTTTRTAILSSNSASGCTWCRTGPPVCARWLRRSSLPARRSPSRCAPKTSTATQARPLKGTWSSPMMVPSWPAAGFRPATLSGRACYGWRG